MQVVRLKREIRKLNRALQQRSRDEDQALGVPSPAPNTTTGGHD